MYSNEWKNYIPEDGINGMLAKWHDKQPDREQDCASPSTLTECPRVVWLKKHKVPLTNDMGWGKKQRLLLGRITENKLAEQLADEGRLLWHWKDDTAGESVRFEHGEGIDKIGGIGDILMLTDDGKVAISDSKTSRADSFAYVPMEAPEIWDDPLWYKYKLQVEAYYLLSHWNKDWFKEHKLKLPEVCHLFSYALDDGIVRREITWTPTKEDARTVIQYARRWNMAYAMETLPECLCEAEDKVKFCSYGHQFERTKSGYKLATACCSDDLNPIQ